MNTAFKTSIALAIALGIYSCGLQPPKEPVTTENVDHAIKENADRLFSEGQRIFRFDTFGSEVFWTQTRLHEALAGISPRKALELGLKVDALKVPPPIATLVATGKANMDDPALTVALLEANAVLGVTGFFDAEGRKLTGIGIQCSLCHSTQVRRAAQPRRQGAASRRQGRGHADFAGIRPRRGQQPHLDRCLGQHQLLERLRRQHADARPGTVRRRADGERPAKVSGRGSLGRSRQALRSRPPMPSTRRAQSRDRRCSRARRAAPPATCRRSTPR